MPLPIDKWVEHNFSNKIVGRMRTDDLLKWTPFTSIFILDLLGVKSKNNWKKHLLIFACCETILSIVSNSLKKVTHEHRPEPTVRFDSFPSGHADTSFAGAEILRIELKDNYPVLSYTGYAIATSVSLLRLYKDKHWLSDIVAGAVLGFACTKLTYWICKGRKEKSAKQQTGSTVHVDETGQLQLGFAPIQ
jgi:membrane-associated phospholipid phosphatase